ncbi:hypothetical protein LWI29_000310 [Acer saccharum]|uniref:EXS domain-containing protein n=1 Tax=Acer saccharum TaxID=4024 RepID=A0AA39RHZ4_ACESA|nr:hypothetical protein LWI29_000310 [Acer saccharum]
MYGINIFYWRKYRVNYSFIFGFKQGTELGYRQVFLVSFGIAVLALLTVIGNLDMEANPITQDYNRFIASLPLSLLILLIVLLFMPFNFLYRSSRFFFLTCLFHGIAAPLYKVTLPDFLLADQLTSQVQALRSLEFFICYYGRGDISHRRNKCSSSGVYNVFFFVVAVLPYMSRLLQCLRRMFEEKDAMQGWNGLKYFITIVAVCMRTALLLDSKNLGWIITSWIFFVVATVVGTYWDLVYDWGLLNRKSKNPWLRDKLLALNILLRLAWMQTVLDIAHISAYLHFQTWLTIVACLEIIRRGRWNFFRFKEGPFGQYLDMIQPIRVHGMLIYNLLKRQLIGPKEENDDEMWFGLGEKKARFRREEFCLCSGLNMGTLPEGFQEKEEVNEESILTRYFVDENPSIELLEATFNRLTEPSEGDDALKMGYLLMVSQFFGMDKARTAIPSWVLSLVEDINAFESFPWGSYIFDVTLCCLKNAADKHIEKLRGIGEKKEENEGPKNKKRKKKEEENKEEKK